MQLAWGFVGFQIGKGLLSEDPSLEVCYAGKCLGDV